MDRSGDTGLALFYLRTGGNEISQEKLMDEYFSNSRMVPAVLPHTAQSGALLVKKTDSSTGYNDSAGIAHISTLVV